VTVDKQAMDFQTPTSMPLPIISQCLGTIEWIEVCRPPRKGHVKVVPVYAMDTYAGVVVYYHSLLLSALE